MRLDSDYVGYWHVADGNIRVHIEKPPSIWRKFWFRLFFGIVWIPKAKTTATLIRGMDNSCHPVKEGNPMKN